MSVEMETALGCVWLAVGLLLLAILIGVIVGFVRAAL